MDLNELTLEQLIESIPENRPLYKDSGLWQILDDDTNEPIMYQTCNENLKAFIIRYIEFLRTLGYDENLEIDLAMSKCLHE